MNDVPNHQNSSGFSRLGNWLIQGAFIVSFGLVWMRTAFSIPMLEVYDWSEPLLLLTATAVVIQSVSRTLPFQNVVWGGFVIGCIGGTAHAIGTLASIPFGPYTYTQAAGAKIFGVLPWMIPCLWVLFVYASRGMARLILRPWRQIHLYGFWLIGVTTLLALILNLGLEPFASHGKHYWIWGVTRLSFKWHGTPLTNFAGWIVTAGIIMVFVTPMLINKKPGIPVEEHGSGAIWMSLNFLFVTYALKQHFWLGAALIGAFTIAAGILALRGIRWRSPA